MHGRTFLCLKWSPGQKCFYSLGLDVMKAKAEYFGRMQFGKHFFPLQNYFVDGNTSLTLGPVNKCEMQSIIIR